MPKQWRAPCFGLLLSGFSLGFAFAPVLALGLTHFGVSLLSLALVTIGLLYSIFCLPETLPSELLHKKALERQLKLNVNDEFNKNVDGLNNEVYRNRSKKSDAHASKCKSIARWLLRPALELSILNRNNFFRLLSALAFFRV